jgi:hypothetical protein
MVGIPIVVALIVGAIAYQSWIRKGVRPRSLQTQRSESEVREIFARKVAGLGWSVVDDDNPMVAQSPLLAGRRQQIALRIDHSPDHLELKIYVARMWTKGLIARVPYKAHTLRMRMNAFERAVGAGGSSGPIGPATAPAGATNASSPPHSVAPSPGFLNAVPTASGVVGSNPFLADGASQMPVPQHSTPAAASGTSPGSPAPPRDGERPQPGIVTPSPDGSWWQADPSAATPAHEGHESSSRPAAPSSNWWTD